MNRRKFIDASVKATMAVPLGMSLPLESLIKVGSRIIPSSGEEIPMVGLGSWITFDVGNHQGRRDQMRKVLAEFINDGGRLVDSSPMYGSSEEVIGALAADLDKIKSCWFATKVWTHGASNGRSQIASSLDYFRDQISLLQIHNLRDFETHYPYLRQLKDHGKIKYIGVTHYLNSAHNKLAEIIEKYPLDFLQVNYNVENPHAEKRLLGVAADHGLAVIVNRPFQTGRLFRLVAGKAIPAWILERGVNSWATYFLKYILSHPHITCAIPATTQVAHVGENLAAGKGWLPDGSEHRRMQIDFQKLV